MKLSLKVNISILIIFVIIVLIFISTLIPFQNARMNNSLKIIITMLNILSESERINLANEIFEKRINAIKLRLKKIINIDNIVSISVYDTKNSLIWEEGNKIILDIDYFDFFNGKDIEKTFFSKKIKFDKNNLLIYIRPVVVIGEHLGFMVIYYNLYDLNKEMMISYIIYLCLLIIICMVLIFLLHSIINWTILKPINYLNNSMIKVQNLGPGIISEINSNDEIGELSKTFNKMSKALAVSYNKIEKQGKILKSSLKEKEILLKELHHRVKNNLNVILSLLELQQNSFKEKNIIENYKKIQNRIYSIYLIHNLLYKSEDITKINIREYIKDLVNNLRNSYNARYIDFIIKVKDLILDIDKIKTLGIILNELIVNSIKYAFKDKNDCKIEIDFFKKDKNYFLFVEDNGVGFRENDYLINEMSGINLVKMLCEELKADIEIINDNGFKVIVSFPMNLKEKIK